MKKLLTLTAVALLTATPALAAGSDINAADGIAAFIFFVALPLCLYFLPAIIGFGRQHQHRVSILLLNLFLG